MSEVDKTTEDVEAGPENGGVNPAAVEDSNHTDVDANGQQTQDQPAAMKRVSTTINEDGKRASALETVKRMLAVQNRRR